MTINRRTFYEWLNKYQAYGANGLTNAKKNKYYPEAIKMMAVRDYLDNKASLREICKKYEISNNSILIQWIKKYNGH
jgi:transposase-like protein